jgi:hypothetical protein
MDESWSIEDVVGVIALVLGFAVVLALIIAVPYFIGVDNVKEDWCNSKGGLWLEQDCYVGGKKVKL